MRKRFLLALGCSSALGLISVAALRPATAIQKPGESTIKVFSYDSVTEPVKITGLSVAGKKVKPGHPFKPDRNWLKDLKVEIKNVGDKNVKSVQLNILANSIMASIPMFYGPSYFIGKGPVPDELNVILIPGATATVEFTGENYAVIEADFNDRPPEALADNQIAVENVIFEDIDSGWVQGKLMKRVGDKWSEVEDKIGRRRTPDKGKSFLEQPVGLALKSSFMSAFLPVSASALCVAALFVLPNQPARAAQSEAQKAQAAILDDFAKPRGKRVYSMIVFSIGSLRRRLKQFDRETFDTAIKQLADDRLVVLHKYDPSWNYSDEEKDGMLKVGEDYYHAVSRTRRAG